MLLALPLANLNLRSPANVSDEKVYNDGAYFELVTVQERIFIVIIYKPLCLECLIFIKEAS